MVALLLESLELHGRIDRRAMVEQGVHAHQLSDFLSSLHTNVAEIMFTSSGLRSLLVNPGKPFRTWVVFHSVLRVQNNPPMYSPGRECSSLSSKLVKRAYNSEAAPAPPFRTPTPTRRERERERDSLALSTEKKEVAVPFSSTRGIFPEHVRIRRVGQDECRNSQRS